LNFPPWSIINFVYTNEGLETMKRYEVVAGYLVNLESWTSVKQIAEDLDMTQLEVRASIQPAKKLLAGKGVMIANQRGKSIKGVYCPGGYKVATFEEFQIETKKAVRRSINHIVFQMNLIHKLERSLPDLNFSTIIESLKAKRAVMTADHWVYEDLDHDGLDEDIATYAEAMQFISDQVSAPDHIHEIANEEIDGPPTM
jgi:hypothetical protein